MGKEKIRYFITVDKQGRELAHCLYIDKINAIFAMAHPDGVFISAKPEVWEALQAEGYTEVNRDYVTQSMRIEEPQPDRIDYTIRQSKKYSQIA